MTSWDDVVEIKYGMNGSWVPVSAIKYGINQAWVTVTAEKFSGSAVAPYDPGSLTGLLLGSYRGAPSTNPDEGYFSSYGSYPMATLSYYTSGLVNETYETARLKRGTHLFADLDTKANAGMIVDIATWTPTGQAYVDRFWSALQRSVLAAKAAGSTATAWGSLNHEMMVKRKQIQSGQTLSGVAYTTNDLTIANYAAAFSRFASRQKELAPDCKSLYWMGATYASADDATVWASLTTAPDGVAADPYVFSEDTFALPSADWKPVIDFIRADTSFKSWNSGKTSIHIAEFAIDRSFGDTSLETYYEDIPNAMDTLGVTTAVHFNVDRTDANGRVVAMKIDGGTTPLAKAAYATSVEQVRSATSVPPQSPSNVRVTNIGSTSVTLAWDAAGVASGAAPVTEYDVLDASGVVRAASVTTSTQIDNLAPSTAYTFHVVAYNGETSLPSTSVSATTLAVTTASSAPTGLQVLAVTQASVSLSWNAATLAAGAPSVSEYRVYRDGVQVGTTAGTELTFVDTGLSATTTYAYTVRAFNGALSASSTSVSTTTSAPTIVAPNAPTNLASTSTGSVSVSLSWTGSTLPTGAPAVTEYRVYRGSTQIATAAATSTSYVATGLTASTPYTFTVRAYNGSLSAASNTLSVTTAASSPSSVWTLIYDVDLSAAPTGTTYSTGQRTTDQAYNRAANATYSSTTGLTILAQRNSASPTGFYSADVKMNGLKMPNHCALEVDITLLDYLGVGMFPAFWSRPQDPGTGAGAGEGERDFWEYCGGYVGQTNEWKETVITTPYGSTQKQAVSRFASKMTSPAQLQLGVKHRWRAEATLNTLTLFCDGTQVGQITKALYDSTNPGDGRWTQFETTDKTWYPRFTYQVGIGSAASNGGAIPTDWTQARMRVQNLKIYRLTSE